MRCPVCEPEKVKHTVQQGFSRSTLLGGSAPYYDEDDKVHNHDPNTSSVTYECSNGHKWTVKAGHSCWCGWRGGENSLVIHEAAGR
jgi:hypothetical protein